MQVVHVPRRWTDRQVGLARLDRSRLLSWWSFAFRLLACVVSVSACGPSRAPEIHVHFPQSPDDLQVGALPATFVFGNVQPANAALTINGRPAHVRLNGTFLENVPLAPGDFVMRLEATNGAGKAAVDVPLRVAARESFAEGNLLDLDALEPAGDLELAAGDRLVVRARGASALTGSFEIADLRRGVPLIETAPGHYEGEYRIRADDRGRDRAVRVTLGDPRHQVEATARGRVTILDRSAARVGVLQRPTEGLVRVRRMPQGPPFLLLPNGITTLVTGRDGEQARIRLSDELDGWIPIADLRLLPPGAPGPRARIRDALVSREPRSSRLLVAVDNRVPYRVEHVANRFILVLSSSSLGSTGIRCRSDDARVTDVRCAADGETVRVALRLSGDRPLWGYHVEYTNEGLAVELRWPPSLAGPAPLSGAVVVLDPGHSPSDSGRVGPLGIPERTHNLHIARRLAALLAAQGARIVMTRTRDDEEVSLQRRLDIAWEARGDVFISLHCNSLVHGIDPYAAPRGFSVFYGQPYSLDLADSIHNAYRRFLPLADEGVRFNDLFVTVAPEMPSVVVESAYFMLPEQEQLLLTPAFQNQVARALLEGIQKALRPAALSGSQAARRTLDVPGSRQ